MTPNSTTSIEGTALIVGASRGLGLAIAGELLARGWRVVGTARAGGGEALEDLAARSGGRATVETLDINEPDQIAALRDRLSGRSLDMLFVNAGTTAEDANGLQRIGGISTDEFVRVMVTNALSPMRVIEGLESLVPVDGLIGAMSSGQGSIGGNERGSRELYRGSKAALNMFMRSFAARGNNKHRALLLMAPGWVKTDLGGPDASYTIEESAPKLVDVLIGKLGRPGLEYLDRNGDTTPW